MKTGYTTFSRKIEMMGLVGSVDHVAAQSSELTVLHELVVRVDVAHILQET